MSQINKTQPEAVETVADLLEIASLSEPRDPWTNPGGSWSDPDDSWSESVPWPNPEDSWNSPDVDMQRLESSGWDIDKMQEILAELSKKTDELVKGYIEREKKTDELVKDYIEREKKENDREAVELMRDVITMFNECLLPKWLTWRKMYKKLEKELDKYCLDNGLYSIFFSYRDNPSIFELPVHKQMKDLYDEYDLDYLEVRELRIERKETYGLFKKTMTPSQVRDKILSSDEWASWAGTLEVMFEVVESKKPRGK